MSVTPEYYLEPIVNDEWTGGAPTRAIIDYLVGHGFLIDTAAMDRGEHPTIMCMNNNCRWSSKTWRNLAQIVREYQICDIDDGGCNHSGR